MFKISALGLPINFPSQKNAVWKVLAAMGKFLISRPNTK
jgi:hypothetical protein